MSKFEFKLPDIGEGVTEGEIVSWLVAVGDEVEADQEMVEVMTDKATVTIGAPQKGKVVELCGGEGDVIPVGSNLVVFEVGGAAAASAPAAAEPAQAPAKPQANDSGATAVGDIKESLPGIPSTNDKPLAAPATRKLARELGVELGQIPATGSAGRITREDVEKFAGGGGQAAPAPGTRPAAPPAPPAPAPLPVSAPAAAKEDKRVPLRGLRKRIAENMARSKRTAAHFTYADEVECTKLIELRKRTLKYGEEAGVKLTFLPFIVKATVAALKKHPMLNTWVDDVNNEMIHKASFDIGIATATDAGLIVPVVRGADRLSILEIAKEIARLAADARVGKVNPADVGGSTFTVTSLGKLGGLFSTPVVNYPEVAIMGIHEMKKRPIIVDDEIRIGNVMVLALSFDHRIIDGHIGAAFAQEVKSLLEDPDRLLVEMA
ncbi:MAG TPA: dihydrolipoamide acetyltransferase family protein [Polyangiaceae bacterium]|nr:dihydrolipoamide acetyltransferase family protein [Polyangiaceae bacterium]